MKKLFAFGLLLSSSALWAQAPEPAAISVAPMNCTRPVLLPPTKALSKKESEKLNADNKSYQDCVKAYVNARKAVVDEHNAISKAHADAAVAAQTEFNAYVTELNANLAAREKTDE
ncbi:hypothetical protein ED208_07140 [Stagnimonas aquatica]|uniref:DUF4398 domain-containing protein n=1 Tax=Stagnimonas aquatica TaxID=2689987 RepID=A0A3N0VHF6_9GAMM|nr:hypothetical protein [Stagnimonas aquatica]ROH92134.1 hypothetical protein ED208_07140 [Stagnimonas aquatica]